MLRVLVAGLGSMGRSHALAYHRHPGFEIVGLVNRSVPRLPDELATYPVMSDFASALRDTRPDLVSINTYSDTHADYAVMALEQGAHVFIEKPLATTVADAERVVAASRASGRKLVVGYILRHHPAAGRWSPTWRDCFLPGAPCFQNHRWPARRWRLPLFLFPVP